MLIDLTKKGTPIFVCFLNDLFIFAFAIHKDKLVILKNMELLELKDYRIAVENLAARKENYLMHNYGDEHAKIVCSNIFSNAESHIYIAANSLCNNVTCSPSYIKAMGTFLDKPDTLLQILLTNFSKEALNENRRFFYSLKEHPAYREGRIIIKDTEGKKFWTYPNEEDQNNKIEFHFCTADSIMYRKELDTVNRRAICNFGDKETAKSLEFLFNNAFNSSPKEIRLEDLM